MIETQNNNNNQASLKDTLKKEWRVILYGQSVRFRLIKYAILLPAFAALYLYTGASVTLKVLGVLLIFSVLVHLFYRFKTNTWTKSWGGYKS